MTPAEPKISGHLEAKIDVAEGLSIFRFRLAKDFIFVPGQYATLWLTHAGRTIPRPYSIASSPDEPRVLEFYINLVAEGRLTPSLWDPDVVRGLRERSPETTVAFTGPKGKFVLDLQDPRDLVFVASGTGLAPFISMLRLLNREYIENPVAFRRRRVYVIHGVSYSNNLGYREELAGLSLATLADPDRGVAVIYVPTISRPAMDPQWTGLTGRAEHVLEDAEGTNASLEHTAANTIRTMVRALLHPETHAIYVCGHPGTVDSVVRALTPRGFKIDEDIKRERYYV